MKFRYYFILLFISFFIFSCGGSSPNNSQNNSENQPSDAGSSTGSQNDEGSTGTDSGLVETTSGGTTIGATDSSGDSDGSGVADTGTGESGSDDSSDTASSSGDSNNSTSDGSDVSNGSDTTDTGGGEDSSADSGSGTAEGSSDSAGSTEDTATGSTTGSDGGESSGSAETSGTSSGSDSSGTTGSTDSAEIAPALNPTVTTTTYAATEFLYTGDNPIQTGVEEGTIKPTRVAVIRGKVTERDGDILSGVTITILNHNEYGSTETRSDGMFDMAVNGGGYLTIQYKKEGYIPVQRTIDTPWQDYVWADDVAMIAYDSEVTEIDLSGGTTIQTASGSESSDEDGTRTATILFPIGTTATMTLEDGTEVDLPTLNVRATEYTVGEGGPSAMPATLPANSAYTYAVELSVDEAITAEATEVTFNQPVYFYVENFLGFPVGEPVPTGYYNKEQAAWIPSDSGVIIEILGDEDGDGITEIDADGDGVADDATTLEDLGFTDEERETLTSKYTTGDTLWRVPMEHFSPWDCNWSSIAPPDAVPPTQNENDDQNQDEDDPCYQSGSIIECQNQTLGETISIAGTSFTLNYNNSRVPGRKKNRILNIQVTGDSIPSSLKSVLLKVTVAGQFFETKLSAITNQSYEFKWDGLDGYGREVSGNQKATVEISYVYEGAFSSTSRFAIAGSGTEMTGSSTRQEITISQIYTVMIGALDQKKIGLGGWSLSPAHSYDVNGEVVYFGNGEKRSATSFTNIIERVSGARSCYYPSPCYDGMPAISRAFAEPLGVAVDAEGNYYISDSAYVYKVDTDGLIWNVAGSGSYGYTGDGGPATSATLTSPSGIVVDQKGNLFIADRSNNVVRKVDTSGIITTVAGTGSDGYPSPSGDGGLATSAELSCWDIAVDQEGNLFISDWQSSLIRKVDTSGIITTIAGTGTRGYSGDGGLAISAKLNGPFDIAVDQEGNLFIADTSNFVVRKVDSSGIITTIAGSGSISGYIGFTGDGGLAINAKLDDLYSVTIDKNNDLFIVNQNRYAYDTILKISSVFKQFTNADITISSEDATQLYQFNINGKHQSTVDTLTGTTLYSFGYDSNNLLETITDEDGNVTTINHDGDGNPTSIVGPFGQITTFEVDENGYLKTVTNPAGESYSMTYDENGLLQTFTNPRGYSSSFEYDELGYLETDTDAASNAQTLSRSSTDDGYEVTHTSPEGLTSIYKVETDSTDEKTWTNTLPDGTQSTTVFGTDGSKTTTAPDGTVTTVEIGPDPRFGMEAPITESVTVTTPKGLTYTSSMEREVSLADDDDLLSLETQTDTITVNSKTYTSVYDASSYTQTTTSPESRTVTNTFDSKGKLTESQVGTTLEPTSYTYDSNGRLSTVTVGTTDPRTTIFTYYSDDDSSKGLLESITDSLSQTVTFDYDDAGRMTSQTNPDGSIVAYNYDENGNLTSITPPSKPEHTFTFNNLDLQSTYVSPDIGLSSHTTEYSYNKDKQLELITRPDGKTIDPEYNPSGKIETLDADGDTYTYAYDSTTGLLTSIEDPSGGSLTFTYDGSLLLSSTLTGDVTGSIAFTYNNDFWVTKQTINSTTSISFSYDDDGLLTTAGSESLTRDSDNGLITNTSLSGVTSSTTYTEIGELKTDDYLYSGTSLYSVTYTRDDLGRITDKEETIEGTTVTTSYTYDGAGRLETATNTSTSATYTYDDNGNRETITKDGTTTTPTYDDQDRLTTYGDNTYTYTDNGELLSKTNTEGTTTYAYDVLGNLKTVSLADGTNIEYIIDAQNRRVGKKVDGTQTQGFIYKDQLKPIAELDGSNNITSIFIYATKANIPDYMVKGGVTYRIISDQLGSPRLVIKTSDGSIAQQIDYGEFGNITSDTNPGFQPFGFAGGLYDQNTKLTRFGARDYDWETGRWTAKDPLGFNGGDSNLYRYTFNDPINFIDPYGQDIAVIENGPTKGNPIGHTAIAITGYGVYSFGNATPSGGNILGGNLINYLSRELSRRDTTVTIIKTTADQDNTAVASLMQNYGQLGRYFDNCSSRSNEALDSAKINNFLFINPITGMPLLSNVPGSSGIRALWTSGSNSIFIKKNTSIPQGIFDQFEPIQ